VTEEDQVLLRDKIMESLRSAFTANLSENDKDLTNTQSINITYDCLIRLSVEMLVSIAVFTGDPEIIVKYMTDTSELVLKELNGFQPDSGVVH